MSRGPFRIPGSDVSGPRHISAFAKHASKQEGDNAIENPDNQSKIRAGPDHPPMRASWDRPAGKKGGRRAERYREFTLTRSDRIYPEYISALQRRWVG